VGRTIGYITSTPLVPPSLWRELLSTRGRATQQITHARPNTTRHDTTKLSGCSSAPPASPVFDRRRHGRRSGGRAYYPVPHHLRLLRQQRRPPEGVRRRRPRARQRAGEYVRGRELSPHHPAGACHATVDPALWVLVTLSVVCFFPSCR
jgi:hypothetical protein